MTPVTKRAKIRTHTDSTIADYASGIFSAPNDWVKNFDFTNDKISANANHINVIQYIINNVAGLSVLYRNRVIRLNGMKEYVDVPLIAWRNVFSQFVSIRGPDEDVAADRMIANSPAFFLNETQLTGEGGGDYINAIQLLQSLSIANVAHFRVYPPGTKVTASGSSSNGVIAIYPINKTEARDYDHSNHFNQIKKTGYSRIQEFSAPDYSAKTNIQIPDNRTTLYWTPRLTTDSVSHTASFSFFTMMPQNGSTWSLR